MNEQSTNDRNQHRVAVDAIIERDHEIALVKRNYEPFKDWWAIPGGHVEHGEQVEDAAIRESREETGLAVEPVELLGVYDEPGRDPRGPVITLVYVCELAGDTTLDASTDAKHAEWFLTDDLPDELAFDHANILQDYIEWKNTS